jgi:hypothetical protein
MARANKISKYSQDAMKGLTSKDDKFQVALHNMLFSFSSYLKVLGLPRAASFAMDAAKSVPSKVPGAEGDEFWSKAHHATTLLGKFSGSLTDAAQSARNMARKGGLEIQAIKMIERELTHAMERILELAQMLGSYSSKFFKSLDKVASDIKHSWRSVDKELIADVLDEVAELLQARGEVELEHEVSLVSEALCLIRGK